MKMKMNNRKMKKEDENPSIFVKHTGQNDDLDREVESVLQEVRPIERCDVITEQRNVEIFANSPEKVVRSVFLSLLRCTLAKLLCKITSMTGRHRSIISEEISLFGGRPSAVGFVLKFCWSSS